MLPVKTFLPDNLPIVKSQLAWNLSYGGALAHRLSQRLLKGTHEGAFNLSNIDDDADLPELLGSKLDQWQIGQSTIIASRIIDWAQRRDLISGELCNTEVAIDGLAEYIHGYLTSGQDRMVMIENTCSRARDPVVREFESNHSQIGDYIVHSLSTQDSTIKRAKQCVLEAETGVSLVGLFLAHGATSRLQPNVGMSRTYLTKDCLEHIVGAADQVMISALDKEAYLIVSLRT